MRKVTSTQKIKAVLLLVIPVIGFTLCLTLLREVLLSSELALGLFREVFTPVTIVGLASSLREFYFVREGRFWSHGATFSAGLGLGLVGLVNMAWTLLDNLANFKSISQIVWGCVALLVGYSFFLLVVIFTSAWINIPGKSEASQKSWQRETKEASCGMFTRGLFILVASYFFQFLLEFIISRA